MQMDYLATFHNHFDALNYLRQIKNSVQKADMRPVPRQLSSSCGACVTFSVPQEQDWNDFFTAEMESLYAINTTGYTLVAENE